MPGVHFDVTVRIEADPGRVWALLVDVETWPSWTPSMTSVKRTDGGPLAVGSAARIRQPRIGTMLWRVTELTEGQSFTWEARRPGVHVVASHVIEEAAPGQTQVVLSIEQGGLLGSALAYLTAALARRNVEMEAQGLKTRAESRTDPRPDSEV